MGSIGEVISEARRKQGKTIKDMERATKIRSRYLEAMENDKFDILPGNVYTKGFIRSYATCLGLDPIPLIEQYKREYEEPPPKYEAKTPPIIPPPTRHSKRIALVTTLVLIFLLTIGFFGWSSLKRKPLPRKEKIPPTVEVENKEEKTKSKKSKVTTPIPPSPQPPKELTIKVRVTDEKGCWLRIVVDGVKVYEGTLKKGEVMKWKGKDSIFVRAGNASGVEIEKNGVPIGPLGQNPGIAERIFTVHQ
ncbi:MAG: RodZ domain-containing protein [Actinomycetota bacterium]